MSSISNARTAATAGRSKYVETLSAAWAQHTAPRAQGAPTVVSLFAGCGGSSLGYSMAGFQELLAAEWNEQAAATFRANFHGVPVHQGDVSDLSIQKVLDLAQIQPGELDILDGSPPCQGFSTSGNREFNDPRNQLFREYVRLLEGLRPRMLVMENVSGMVKGKMRLVFVDILKALKDSGYRVNARLLNAMYFGVPQFRRRVIFIGVRDDLPMKPSHPTAQTAPIPVSAAIGDLRNVQDPTRGHTWIDESPRGRNTKTYHKAIRCPQGKKFAGQQKRDSWDLPASTLLTASMIGRLYLRANGCHPLYTRTYSLLEYRRLASFPDEWQFPCESRYAFNQIGNCVPPLFMRGIAEHVARILRQAEVSNAA